MQGGGDGLAQSLGVYAAEVVMSDEHEKSGDLGIAEAASPISSRPPAAGAAESGGASGNRWPRQETLALLQIRSEMDAVFRDATLKGPLWEHVSRKLAELGYKRSAKKCKEKFENVHKYYKRTKEGRGGRQDGKSYKFFNQLEALHHSTSTPTSLTQVLPRIPDPMSAAPPVSLPTLVPQPETLIPPPPDHMTVGTRDGCSIPLFGSIGISFSSESSSSSEGENEKDEKEMGTGSGDEHNLRKRKRSLGIDSSDERMMDFFDGVLKQVMQKQESMQQKFLQAIEKREQDRMIREEAWKRQDMARLAREHDLMAQERAISESRDVAIIGFLEKITGQTIHLPTTLPQNATPTASDHKPQTHNPHPIGLPSQNEIIQPHHHSNTSQEFSSLEIPCSRWPKAEVLALIELRSGLEHRYQETGPKGPLWEEISAGMLRMGYNRSSKRCKEKWENINKYFKKVKESNKKRPQDGKTCPYFHELDQLYRKKILGSTSSANVLASLTEQDQIQQQQQQQQQDTRAFPSMIVGGAKQPEGMLKKQEQKGRGDTTDINCCTNIDYDSYEEVDEDEDYDDEMEMAYKIQFQRHNVSASTAGGTTSTSFMAMVQ